MAGLAGQLATWGEIYNKFGKDMFKNIGAYLDNECVSWGDIKNQLATAGSMTCTDGIANNECVTLNDLKAEAVKPKKTYKLQVNLGCNLDPSVYSNVQIQFRYSLGGASGQTNVLYYPSVYDVYGTINLATIELEEGTTCNYSVDSTICSAAYQGVQSVVPGSFGMSIPSRGTLPYGGKYTVTPEFEIGRLF